MAFIEKSTTFGAYRLGNIPADEIENWLNDELEAGLAPSSVHRHYRTLRRVLQVAVDKQRIVANPCDRADPPAVPNREMVFLDWDQALGLAEAHSPRFRAMVYLAVDSGMRWSELVGLRRAKLDLRRGKVRVSEQLVRLGSGEWLRKGPKTVGSVRSITVSPFTAEVLTDHVERFGAPGPDGLVFPNGAGNPVQSTILWNNHFRPPQQRAGVTSRVQDHRQTSVSLAGIANSRHRPPTFTARGLERVGAGNDPDGQLGAEEVDVLRGSVRQSRREQRGATGEQEAGRLGKREEAPEHTSRCSSVRASDSATGRPDPVDQRLPRGAELPGKDQLIPKVDEERAVDGGGNVLGATFPEDHFEGPGALAAIGEVDVAVAMRPGEMEGKLQGAAGVLRTDLGNGVGNCGHRAAPDRHFPPPDLRPGDQVISRGREDPLQRLEAGRHPAMLIGRQRRPGSPRAARELGAGQSRLLPGSGEEICRHATSVSEQIRSRAPDHRVFPRVATSHRLGKGLGVGVGESDAVLRVREGAKPSRGPLTLILHRVV
jgi:hypothetical protein